MNSSERRSALALASIMSLRMLGLFMVLPLFSLYAQQLKGATPALIGLSLGIYGLTQAFFQIPFGIWSDKVGRKHVITLGLIIFVLGSLLAACAHTIEGMMMGRALQGVGAVGSTIMALLADLTRENQRTKAMAIIGMTIGVSFSLAMLLGPLLNPWIHVNGIFVLAAGMGVLAIFILYKMVAEPTHHIHLDLEQHSFLMVLKMPELIRLNSGIFILHMIFTASFVVIPIGLQNNGISENHQWIVYLPTLIFAFICTAFCIITAEKTHRLKLFFLSAIFILGCAELFFGLFSTHIPAAAFSLFLFFTGFSILEAFLPSFISKTAPPARKGTALGIYSCSQFLGIFAGGLFGGWLYGMLGPTAVYLFCTLLTILWATIAFGVKNP